MIEVSHLHVWKCHDEIPLYKRHTQIKTHKTKPHKLKFKICSYLLHLKNSKAGPLALWRRYKNLQMDEL
jgi:Co/Zn/Cd efflux system component